MKINELISQTDQENLSDQGYAVVDQFEVENYNFALVKNPEMLQDTIGAKYQLGFSKDGTDFTDFDQQGQKFTKPNEKFPLGALGKNLGKIKQWIRKYGPVAIASMNPAKTKLYARVFTRAKFKITSKDMMGMTWLILE